MEELVRCSYRSSFAKELESTRGTAMLCSQDLDECGTEIVVRLTVINPQLEQPLTRAVNKLIGRELACALTNLEPDVESKMLLDKLTVLVSGIAFAMNRLGYASYRGKVYKTHARNTAIPTNVRPGRLSTL